ncbi:restriction endonuclease subunit S [Acinetobacter lwoffii]|nr:restriction endonuclease subunit S [Acinetobacter lwoffii]MCO8078272.1 restriction endonuclease subunit S [Acinetobacter lwoffii]
MSVPKLRLKEFDGDWKSVSLLDISALVTKGTTPKQFINGDINFLKIEAITQSGFDLSKCQTINSEIHNKELKRSILKEGDILFAIAGATIGKNAIVQKELLPANTNQALAIIRLKENYSKVFISKVLNSPLMEKYIDINISTGAQPNLNLQQIGSFSFALPTLDEQTKIASFLSAVDEKISQLTQKHQLLSQYKQGMMQKLFSQQIRFKADDGSEFGEWEDKRISEIASYRRGSFPQPYGLPEWLNENGFPFVQVYDVADNMLLKDKTKIKISQLAANQSVFAKTGTLIITLQGSIGRVAKMQYDAYVDRTLLIFQSYSMPINTDYFKYALYLLFNIEKEKADGGIIKTITKETLSKFNIGIPCLEEQTKIANFLSAMDQKIEVVAQQIEQAKQWKKGLLQQMFV